MAQAARKVIQSLGRRLVPMMDRVLVEKAEAITQTKGGIVIPEKALGKVVQGTVIAAGPGMKNDKGELVPMNVAVGDLVLLPEYGGVKVEMEDKELFLYREHDILAKFKD